MADKKKPGVAGAKLVVNIQKMTGDIKNKVKIKGKSK